LGHKLTAAADAHPETLPRIAAQVRAEYMDV